MSSGVVFAAGGFVFWLIAARLASSETLGLAVGLLSAVSLLNFLTSLGLPYGMLRILHSSGADAGPVLNLGCVLTALTSAAGAAVFVTGADIWAPALAPLLDAPAEIALFVVANIAVSVGLLLDSAFAAARAAQWALARAGGITLGRLAAVPLMATHGPTSLFAATCLAIIATTALTVLCLPRLIAMYSRRVRSAGEAARTLVRFSLTNYPSSLLAGTPAFVLPLLVLTILGPSAAAWFFVAWSFALILQLMAAAISQIALSEAARDDSVLLGRRAHTLALVVLGPLIAIILLGAQPLLALYGTDYAAHAATSLRVLAVAALPWAMFSINLSQLRVAGRLKLVTRASAVFAVLSIGLAAAASVPLGLDGVAFGFGAGTAIAAMYCHIATGHAGRAPTAEATAHAT